MMTMHSPAAAYVMARRQGIAPMRWTVWKARALAALIMALCGVSAAAAKPLTDDPSQLRLPEGAARTSLGAGMRVHGLPVRAEVFQAPATLRATADLIASQPQSRPSLMVLPGAVLLAWQTGRHHWVARLTGQGEAQTRGTVSVLTLPDPGGVLPAAAEGGRTPDWLPAHARLLFDFDSEGGGSGARRMRQGIYVHDLPPDRLWPLVHERLRRAGWRRDPGDPVHDGADRWAKGGRVLTLQVVPTAGGSGMLATESGER